MHIVLIKPDGIGDYLLFRNFLPEIRRKAGSGGRVTALLNPAVRGLADTVDADQFDRIVWLDQRRFRYEPRYRLLKSWQIRLLSADEVVYPVEGRLSEIDWVAQRIRAPSRVTAANDGSNMSFSRSAETDRWYSSVVAMPQGERLFQMERNRRFVQGWLGKTVSTGAPRMERSRLPRICRPDGPYGLLFPGAGAAIRRWPTRRFAEVARAWIARGWTVYVAGSSGDAALAADIINATGSERIHSLCGRIPLDQVAAWTAGAQLVVTNDSFPLHLCASLDVPHVCVSNGNDYGRFHPYPDGVGRGRVVYAPDFTKRLADPASCWGRPSEVDIATVTPEAVLAAGDAVLTGCSLEALA